MDDRQKFLLPHQDTRTLVGLHIAALLGIL
jgi:hypothetical protein